MALRIGAESFGQAATTLASSDGSAARIWRSLFLFCWIFPTISEGFLFHQGALQKPAVRKDSRFFHDEKDQPLTQRAR